MLKLEGNSDMKFAYQYNALKTVFFILLILYVTHLSSFANDYAARNTINSGDNSINAIATGQSQIIVVIGKNGQVESYSKSQFSGYISSKRKDIISKARKQYPNQNYSFIEAITIANFLFEIGQYSASAGVFELSLRYFEGSNKKRNEINGLTTASYYGSFRHLEGLKFICRSYRTRPKWDFRYRHAIHAHLRSLKENLGREKALEILNHVRRNPDCQRADFSPVWIPIHLADMRMLENGTPAIKTKYGFSTDEDRAFAERLMDDNNLPFVDYLHFVAGNHSEILSEFPNSYLFDLALLADGENEDYQQAKNSLFEYINRYDTHKTLALQKLLRRSLEQNDLVTRNMLLEEFGGEVFSLDNSSNIALQINDFTRVWVPGQELKDLNVSQIELITSYYSECPRFLNNMYDSNNTHLIVMLNQFIQDFNSAFEASSKFKGYYGQPGDRQYNGTCIADLNQSELKDLVYVLTKIQDVFDSGDHREMARFGRGLKLCGDIRERKIYGSVPVSENSKSLCTLYEDEAQYKFKMYKFSFHKFAALMLRKSNEIEPVLQSSSLYLSGLALRNSKDYSGYLKTMEEYLAYYPDAEFADDALTEIGWYNLSILQEPENADSYFLQVVDKFPDRNSYDNALNWLVISKRSQGKIYDMARYSALLAADISSKRLSLKVADRKNIPFYQAKAISENEARYVIGENLIVGWSSFFGERKQVIVTKAETDFNDLKKNSVIQSVNDEKIEDAVHFYEVLFLLKEHGHSYANIKISGESDVQKISLSLFGI